MRLGGVRPRFQKASGPCAIPSHTSAKFCKSWDGPNDTRQFPYDERFLPRDWPAFRHDELVIRRDSVPFFFYFCPRGCWPDLVEAFSTLPRNSMAGFRSFKTARLLGCIEIQSFAPTGDFRENQKYI